MAQKCVHQGCGKEYTDADEVCKYHPGPPVFHEGQKGWTCCKPRVLTFEEFMSIEPCTQGKHSTTDLPPKVEKKKEVVVPESDGGIGPAMPRTPISVPTREKPQAAAAVAAAAPTTAAKATATPPPAPAEESSSDDESIEIPQGRTCRRRGCGVAYSKRNKAEGATGSDRSDETCVYHPGAPIFHEGSKGYSCCKRRVLEFDQFMKIEGCHTKKKHLFSVKGQKEKGASGGASGSEEELLENVRFDFYQSATSLTVSFFLKKIDKAKTVVTFSENGLDLDLPTTDTPTPKRYKQHVPLYGAIDPAKSRYTVLGTKLEVVLTKAAVGAWPVLRSDDRPTGEIFQVARAGKATR